MNQKLDITHCFKLPWSELDNPNGWIEPTTYCNIACLGCYRGVDKPDHQMFHLELEELKSQIDWFVSKRNVHTISIAGGEPLMYPHIFELISYAAKAKCRVMLYTNGVLLTREMALKLAEAGLTQVVVHVDRFQSRPDIKQGETFMQLRERFVEIFKTIPKLRLGFIQPISADCSDELNHMMDFLNKNMDIVNLMVFTLYHNICWNEGANSNPNTDISMQQVVNMIGLKHGFVPAAYLPSMANPEEPTWLFSQRVGLPNQIFGYFSSSFYRFAHKRYREKHNKHLFISRTNSIDASGLWRFLGWTSVRRILYNFLKFKFSSKKKVSNTLFFQTILVLRGPEKKAGKWDLCNGCPDRMIYKGKLVPSCILEDLRKEDISAYKNATLNNPER
jgi:hypothetical protein